MLAEICARKRGEVADAIESRSLDAIETDARAAPLPRDFAAALEAPGISLVAEIKRASPSKGEIAPDLEVSSIAGAYEEAGASAISVLTDEAGFAGTLADLTAARESVSLPLLRKDFIVDPYQVFEARAAGADAILLIVGALDQRDLESMLELSQDLGMASLVEVHDGRELGLALDSGASIVGVNNRDLRTFEVSLTTCIGLADQIPSWVLGVAESGISTRTDVELVESAGYDAILVGESLLISGNVEGQVHELLGR
ncbi:MAG: indole-3-glycerol phosphate synthase TrpC [Acidobacteria bacterium]|nr:MAG: indole-3-glycerol phosphate synthase TrpC [Acidobacteriota bacterium]